MSVDAAHKWLLEHPPIIPALDANAQQVKRHVHKPDSGNNLVELVCSDPGFSLALLQKVNAKRHPDSGREPVESDVAAFSLLGEPAVMNLVDHHPVCEQQLTEPDQLFLFQQIINRALHNEVQAEVWSRQAGFKQLEPIKMAAQMAYLGEALCCAHDFTRYRAFIDGGASPAHEEEVFGFSFDQLTAAVVAERNLPDLIARALPAQDDAGQRSRLIRFLSQICRQCEHGWYCEPLVASQKQFADYLQLPLDQVVAQLHGGAVDAARLAALPDAWQPAARLVLSADRHWHTPAQEVGNTPTQAGVDNAQASSEPAASAPPSTQDLIKQRLQSPATTQSDLLTLSLEGLHQELKLDRACLLLLSKDRRALKSRMAIGIDQQAALRHYEVLLEQAGLFKVLLQKPQAVWINPANFSKYEKLIPGSFKASVLTTSFFAMSLFIANKPIGIVYADCSDSERELDQALFTRFKQQVLLCSKALSLLARRRDSAVS